MEKTKKEMRLSEAELGLIKTTFADNEDLLKAIRKVFWQAPLDVIDSQLIEGIRKNKSVLKVLRKLILPELEGNAPIHQVIDLWMTLEIKGKTPEMVAIDAKARALLIEYLDQQLKEIEGNKVDGRILFSSLVDIKNRPAEAVYVDLVARNTLLSHIEQQINQLLVLAGTKEETVEETKERLLKNSAK